MKEQYREIIRYLVVGLLTTIVSLVTYYTCVLFFLNPQSALELQMANICSWIVAVTFAYVTNRVFVFQSKRKDWLQEAMVFYSSRIITLFIDMIIMFLMVTLCGFNDKVAKLMVQVVGTVANYIYSKLLVFRTKNIEN